MNRILRLFLLVLLLSSVAFSQSLGDIARQNRHVKRTPAKHVYTNDDLASRLPEVSQTSSTPVEGSKPADKEASKDSTDSAKKSEKQPEPESEEANQKKWEQFKSRIADQKGKIDLIQRELEVAKRQNEIQVTEYYADAGSRLRNPQYFSEQMKKYQDTIDAKSKALEEAKSVLETTLEEARKAGVPASYLD